MKAVLAFCLFGVASASAAQVYNGKIGSDTGFTNQQPLLYGYARPGKDETPTMRAQKYKRAVALREEAASLLRQDGGTLTRAHETYLREKACAILTGGRIRPGTTIPQRCA